jgi:DNA polymerase-3 subunit chi
LKVDFYVLSDEAPDARLRCACRLAEEAVDQGRRVYLRASSAAEAQRLDDLLWTYRDGSFIPHEIYAGAPASHATVMVLVGEADAPESHRQLLINLAPAVPEDLQRYEAIAEIVDVDPTRKSEARERYKQYREHGCSLDSHNL